MGFQGTLDWVFLSSILQILADEGRTGVLHFKHEDKRANIFVVDGEIVYATKTGQDLLLGSMLKDEGLLTEAACQDALEEARSSRQALGSVLVDKGLVTLPVLKETITRQAMQIIYDIFLWPSGEFHYDDRDVDTKGFVPIRLNVMQLVLEASRRIDEMNVFKKMLPSEDMILVPSFKMTENKSMKISSVEWHLLSLIDGKKTLRQVLDTAEYSRFEVYGILHTLMLAGVVKPGSATTGGMTETDYFGAVNFYLSIITALIVSIEKEFGVEAAKQIQKCISETIGGDTDIFSGMANDSNPSTYVSHIVEIMGKSNGKTKGYAAHLANLDEFFKNLLLAIQQTNGKTIVRLMDEIDGIIKANRSPSGRMNLKQEIVDSVEQHVAQCRIALKQGKKSRGFFSFLKKKD